MMVRFVPCGVRECSRQGAIDRKRERDHKQQEKEGRKEGRTTIV
jgi:hypothetical protein